jgi:hypothetical protein
MKMVEGRTHMEMRHQICEILDRKGFKRSNFPKGYSIEHDDDHGTLKSGDGLSLFYDKKSEETRVSKPDIFVLENGKLKCIIEIEDKKDKKYLSGVLTLSLLGKYYSIRKITKEIENADVVLFLIPIEGEVLKHMKKLNDEVIFPIFKSGTKIKKSIVCSVEEFEGKFDETLTHG